MNRFPQFVSYYKVRISSSSIAEVIHLALIGRNTFLHEEGAGQERGAP